jgi:hypothetical protein
MSRKELFKQLNRLCEELNYKYNINSGGCCYVAAVLAEQFELHNIPFTVIHYNECGCHYAIKVSDRYINRDDYRKKEISEYLDWSSSDLFAVYNDEDWNKCYSTTHNSTVRKSIVKVFNKYENCRA